MKANWLDEVENQFIRFDFEFSETESYGVYMEYDGEPEWYNHTYDDITQDSIPAAKLVLIKAYIYDTLHNDQWFIKHSSPERLERIF